MAILANQRVLTLDYWKLAKNLVPGDYVFDKDGQPVKITLVQECHSEACYEVTFNDLLTICGNKNLCLPIEDRDYRYRASVYKGKFKFKRPLTTKSLENLLELPLFDYRNRKNFSVQTAKPLQLPHQTLPVPPFVFGYWFYARGAKDKMGPPAVYRDYVHQKFKDAGYKITTHETRPNDRQQFTVKPTVLSHLIPNVPNKIPNNYLLASFEQRLELLSGIMHAKSRQYSKTRDVFQFSTKNLNEASQIQFLAESLGCKTKLLYNKYYTIFIETRLRLTLDQKSPPFRILQARRFVNSISLIPAQLCIHIETENKNHSILVGEGFIPTC
jgi:hypothetical protein